MSFLNVRRYMLCKCAHIHVHTHARVCIYINMCVCACMHIYIYIHMHIYIYTQIPFSSCFASKYGWFRKVELDVFCLNRCSRKLLKMGKWLVVTIWCPMIFQVCFSKHQSMDPWNPVLVNFHNFDGSVPINVKPATSGFPRGTLNFPMFFLFHDAGWQFFCL